MIEIHQDSLIPNMIYFIECSFTDADIKPNKYKAILTQNVYKYATTVSKFHNVITLENNKKFCDLELLQPATGSSYVWKFYLCSLPIYENNRLNRLYSDAINKELQRITGDEYFTFY